MNTMADGAAQRLVAQIGEALFDQPGMTLMELAEKVKGMNLQTAHAAYKTGKAIGRRECEMEAQHSLAGQVHGEESCEKIEAELQFYREEAFNLTNILIGTGVFSVDHEGDYKAAWANIITGIERLAARQPVASNQVVENFKQLGVDGQPVVTDEMLAAADAYHDSDEYRSGQFSDSHTNAACYRAMAAVAPPARQPVGEPIGYLIDSGNPEIGRYFSEYPTTRAERCRPIYDGNGEVYAAPTGSAK